MNKGIPTTYGGRLYRSRLEARWATFFDFMEWQYEYEPYDLNGWIPDFSIIGKEEIIVEIKPFFSLADYDVKKIQDAIKGTDKIDKEVLLLGATILPSACWGDATSIGWLREKWWDGWGKDNYDEAILNHYHGKYGFFSASGSYEDRITGLYDGDHFLDTPPYRDIKRMWEMAGNAVQWAKGGGDERNA